MPFPERFLLGGERHFSQELPQLIDGWVVCRISDSPSVLAIEPLRETSGNEFRFFSRFRDLSRPKINSQEFDHTPIIEYFSWDWIDFKYKPLDNLEVSSTYWSPDSGVICGENWISNLSDQKREVSLDIVCSLQSQGAGNQITLEKVKGRPVLTGSFGDQILTLFMAGNPDFREDPFPYLQNKLSLLPHGKGIVNWICLLSDSAETGMVMLESVLQLDWAGEISRRKVSLHSQLEISTGDPDWDVVLALSQKQAQLICNQISFAENATIPQNAELTTIQALMLLQSLDNQTPDLMRNILDLVFMQNYQPGFEGKDPDYRITPPILAAELLWQIHKFGISSDIWSSYLGKVSEWVDDWFSPRFDRDRDGIPELVNPLILDLPGSHSTSDELSSHSIMPYPYLESPGLGAILFNDLCKLENLLQLTGKKPDSRIQERKENLRVFLQDSWISEDNEFQSRDSHSHSTTDGFIIIESLEPGLNILKADLPHPARIGMLHQRSTARQVPGVFSIICHGLDSRGNYRIEEIHSANLVWGEGLDWAISESIYTRIDYCILNGFDQKGKISLIAPPTSPGDITLMLPLWSGVLSDDHTQEIFEEVLLDPDRYWSPYGFSSIPGTKGATVPLFWNLLLGQTLIKLGRIDITAELITRWMNGIMPTHELSGGTIPSDKVNSRLGLGSIDSMESLFPIRFFLQVLGIEVIQDDKLVISGINPFPWPVSLRYRGYVIRREKDQTIITHPGKETITLKDPQIFQLDLI